VEEGLDCVERAVFERDAHLAVVICYKEAALDALYEKKLRLLAAEKGHDTLSLLTLIFIYHYLERMGDALLNIGEAILSASLGESVKFEQYQALERSLSASEDNQPIAGVTLETVAETRSGCRIGRVRQLPAPVVHSNGNGNANGNGNGNGSDKDLTLAGSNVTSTLGDLAISDSMAELVIFKEGQLQKLIDERRSAERWQELMPGLPPKILSFHENKNSAAILFEYLSGRTFEDLVLRGTDQHLSMALDALFATLELLWKRTYVAEPVAPRFLKQLVDRLDDVYALHPELRNNHQGFGNVNVPSFEDLVQSALSLDDVLVAPFSVFIHGDFNLDNIIHGGKDDGVHFIDLHRSRMMDYVQDITVLLVSVMRLRVLEAPVRQRMHEAVTRIYEVSHKFADQNNDTLFAARVSMGLVRSLATSARFVLDPGFASDLLLRARYLLEQLLAHDSTALQNFALEMEVLLD
jgi:Ser/Thr protein kinase RdoA (MazF antagonist)